MTPEELSELKDMLDLIEDGRKQTLTLLSIVSTLLGVLQAKEMLSADEMTDLFAFIEHSLPVDCSETGQTMLATARSIAATVLKSSRPA